MIPSDSKLIGVKNKAGQTETNLLPEITQEKGRQEVGVYIEISPNSSEDITFEWQNNLPKNPINSYGLFVRKQAGVDASPMSVKFAGITNIQSNPIFTLTKSGGYSYNTNLAHDFFARLYWK
jgi:hypothetical protein